MSDNQQSLHWLAVGKISNAAEREVTRKGGQVVYCAAVPPITLVGIAYEATARPDDLALSHASEIQMDVHSSGLSLLWLSSDRLINAAYSSLTDTELLTYAEYEDMLSGRAADSVVETLPEIEDRPF